MPDIVIHSNRVVLSDGVKKAAVIITNGKIEEVTFNIPEVGCTVIDFGDHVIMPGIVDPHVHINEPGRTEWEGFDTATKAAIAGGVTTFVDMPLNSSPVTTTVSAFDKKLQASNGKLHTNCGFWGGVIPGNAHEIESLINAGVLGFKAFLTHSGIEEFPNVTEDDLRKVMPLLVKHNLPLLVHCELTDNHTYSPQTTSSYNEYLLSRPCSWEDNAIALMIRLCEEFECRTHIVHLSSSGSIEQIRKAKERGAPLTVETAQHYLYFCAEEIPDGHAEYKCAPPIRERINNEKLWQALKEGIIDFVATDHSPAPPSMKENPEHDLMKAWGGIASIQFALPVLWTAAKRHDCSLTNIVQWLCEKPAELPGLKTKGRVLKGYDADLTIWNPQDSFTVSADKILHRHKLTPYMGKQLNGVVNQTWLNGIPVFGEGKILNLNKGKIIAS